MANYQSKHTGAEIDAGIDAANAALPMSGGTMTGALILNDAPTSELQAANKKYVDDAINSIVLTPGEDGFSPTVTVEEITGGHRVTITDAEGTKSFEVMDGVDSTGGDGSGDMLKSVYDADGDGIVDDAVKLGGKLPSAYKKCINYAFAETLTGDTWIDGRPIYRQVLSFGNIGNNSSAAIALNSGPLAALIRFEGYGKRDTSLRPIPLIGTTLPLLAGIHITNFATNPHAEIITGSDAGFNEAWLIVEYTKTADATT